MPGLIWARTVPWNRLLASKGISTCKNTYSSTLEQPKLRLSTCHKKMKLLYPGLLYSVPVTADICVLTSPAFQTSPCREAGSFHWWHFILGMLIPLKLTWHQSCSFQCQTESFLSTQALNEAVNLLNLLLAQGLFYESHLRLLNVLCCFFKLCS